MLSERRGSERFKAGIRSFQDVCYPNEKMDLLYAGNELCEIQSCWREVEKLRPQIEGEKGGKKERE